MTVTEVWVNNPRGMYWLTRADVAALKSAGFTVTRERWRDEGDTINPERFGGELTFPGTVDEAVKAWDGSACAYPSDFDPCQCCGQAFGFIEQ